jgi:hypothetical protein
MIVIPMAGLSARFAAAGYDRPKYMLPLAGATLFDHAVKSFAAYFADTPFLFVVRDVQGSPAFVAERAAALGIATTTIVALDAPTVGQAETVAIGLRRAQIDPAAEITIFNIDTFRPGFRKPDVATKPGSGGYLEVFEGHGANWSFVRPDPADTARVIETAEKRAISRLCCTGLYHFAAARDFLGAFDAAIEDPALRGPKDEIYVAPLYNWLIARGQRIGYDVVPRESVIFCGVPAEYDALRAEQWSAPAP